MAVHCHIFSCHVCDRVSLELTRLHRLAVLLKLKMLLIFSLAVNNISNADQAALPPSPLLLFKLTVDIIMFLYAFITMYLTFRLL